MRAGKMRRKGWKAIVVRCEEANNYLRSRPNQCTNCRTNNPRLNHNTDRTEPEEEDGELNRWNAIQIHRPVRISTVCRFGFSVPAHIQDNRVLTQLHRSLVNYHVITLSYRLVQVINSIFFLRWNVYTGQPSSTDGHPSISHLYIFAHVHNSHHYCGRSFTMSQLEIFLKALSR